MTNLTSVIRTMRLQCPFYITTNGIQFVSYSGEENVGEGTFTGFEFNIVQYDKDEYIKTMAEKNSTIETQLTNTQLALVELYEGMAV